MDSDAPLAKFEGEYLQAFDVNQNTDILVINRPPD